MKGVLYGVGVGPGDPDLLTLKACKALEKADVICIPKSRMERKSVALNIITKVLKNKPEIIELFFPMTKDREQLNKQWDENTRQVVDLLAQGKNVAVITIGDSMLYSTYGYIMKRVLKNYPEYKVETIPGISSAFAFASQLNVILAEEDESLAIIPARKDRNLLKQDLENHENIFLMKVAKNYDQILDLLAEINFSGEAYLISKGGHDDQIVTSNLEEWRGKELNYLSSILLKKEVK